MSHLKSLLNFTIFSAPFRRSSSAPIDGNTLSGNVDPRITFSSSSFNLIRPICMVTSLSLFSFFAFFPDLLLINLELRSFPFFLYTRQRWVECFDVAFFLKSPFLIQQHIKNRHLLLLLSTHNYDKTSLQWVIVNHNPSKTSWRTAKFAGKANLFAQSLQPRARACVLFVCSVCFLFAAFVFCFAAFVFCLQRSFFVCSIRFLFAAFLLFAAYVFYLQFSFFLCSVLFYL